jgi:hypothetical protein
MGTVVQWAMGLGDEKHMRQEGPAFDDQEMQKWPSSCSQFAQSSISSPNSTKASGMFM